MIENRKMLNVEAISFDTDNPRIKMALEKYGDQLNSERIHSALRSAADGTRGTSSYAHLRDSILASGGVISPITARIKDDGYVCIDGNTHLAIYKQFLKENVEGTWSEIKAIVLDNTNQRDEVAILENTNNGAKARLLDEKDDLKEYLNNISELEEHIGKYPTMISGMADAEVPEVEKRET